MSQEIEIEFKSLLTEEEYTGLLHEYAGERPTPYSQTNYYADTPDFKLKDHGSALRVRRFHNQTNECTLKTPHNNHLLETTFDLDDASAEKMIQENDFILSKEMTEKLEEMNIPIASLRFFGSLRTERFEKQVGDHLIVLDKSYYGDQVDYELEVESNDEKKGEEFFQQLLEDHQLPYRKADNKIKRAMKEWLKEQ